MIFLACVNDIDAPHIQNQKMRHWLFDMRWWALTVMKRCSAVSSERELVYFAPSNPAAIEPPSW